VLRPAQSDTNAVWVSRALDHDPQYTVAGLVTRDYPAFVRILHPAFAADGGPVPWRAIADAVGGTIHPSVQWHSLERKMEPDTVEALELRTDRGGFAPEIGDLSIQLMRRLFSVLAVHAKDPICMAAYWIGRGRAREWPAAPHICIPEHRREWEYALFSGTLTDVLEERELGYADDPLGYSDGPLEFSPNFLWPHDRAWLLSTQEDFDSTIVGGTESLIADICSQSALETVLVSPSVSLTIDADTVN
jgi:hypothetical protein